MFGYIVFLTPMCMAVLWYFGIPSSPRAFERRNVQQRWRPDPLARVSDDALGFGLLWLQAFRN